VVVVAGDVWSGEEEAGAIYCRATGATAMEQRAANGVAPDRTWEPLRCFSAVHSEDGPAHCQRLPCSR
jgi:hypothetical protein